MTDLSDAVGDATATLVCTSSMGAGTDCTELLDEATPSTTVLWVTFTRSPAACVEQYRAAGGVGSLSVIAVGDTSTDTEPEGSDVTVRTVSTPDDLTGLGITLSQLLSTNDDTIVCFDSLTVLLQYVDCETAYEFLNAVTSHLYAADARAHFHLDPSALDDRTIDALASLFDAIAEREDGEWSVRRRRLLQPNEHKF